MDRYDPLKIEAKWQKIWQEKKSFPKFNNKIINYDHTGSPNNEDKKKPKENAIDPLDIINEGYGADTLQVYEMFVGPIEHATTQDFNSIGGVYRFLNRCWNLCFLRNEEFAKTTSEGHPQLLRGRSDEPREDGSEERPEEGSFANSVTIRHKTIKKVTEDIDKGKLNTAVAALMKYVNVLYKVGAETEDLTTLAKLLRPFAPHLASEMLEKLNADDSWPKWDDTYLKSGTVEVIAQVNGKLRAKLEVSADKLTDEKKLIKLALAEDNIKKYTEDGIKKTIFVPKERLINIVV